MTAGPKFNLAHEVTYGAVERVSALVDRVTCENPSRFTFTGTGTYIVGTNDVVIVDPGPSDDNHIDALVAAVGKRNVTHFLITHTHGDHSPAAAVLATHFDAPTVGFGPHPVQRPDPDATVDPDSVGFGFEDHDPDADPGSDTGSSGSNGSDETEDDDGDGYRSDHAHDWDFEPDLLVGHGEVVDGAGLEFEALHTPGHISNHLCFALRQENSLFCGDHVMGWSTTIIPPPDGNLNDYLDSLRLLVPRHEQVYYPTHGAPITDPEELVPALLSHRQARSNQILDCLADGRTTVKEMVLHMYTHIDAKLHNAAGASVMSHLLALCETGQVSCRDQLPTGRSNFDLA